jgi:stage II sporulation protein D
VRLSSAGAPLRINKRPYPGVLELIPSEKLVINEVGMETYLLGVIGKESYTDFEYAALRAQAVASRTYALYQVLFYTKRPWHVEDNTSSQMYAGSGGVADRIRKVVAETRGLVLTYEGKVFQSYFHSTCGGNTTKAGKFYRDADVTPLAGTSCSFCRPSPDRPFRPTYTWEADYSEPSVRRALAAHPEARAAMRRHGVKLGRITGIEPILDPGDIHAEYVRIYHEFGRFELFSPILQQTCNSLGAERLFKSVAITGCELRGDILHFKGRGYGHGVGMCQFGAQGQALEGRNFIAILNYYYPEAVLMQAWPYEIAARE